MEIGEDGKKFITNDKGEKVAVFMNEFGEECIMDENGYVIPLS